MTDAFDIQMTAITATVLRDHEKLVLPGGKTTYKPFIKGDVTRDVIAQAYDMDLLADPRLGRGSPTSKARAHEANFLMVQDRYVDKVCRASQLVAGNTARKYLAWRQGGQFWWQRADHISLSRLHQILADYERRARQMEARADGVYQRIKMLEQAKRDMHRDDEIRLVDIGEVGVAV